MKKYYDIKESRLINLDKEVCQLSEWVNEQKSSCLCAIHPDGFHIFTSPEELAKSDEYNEDDPYSVSDNIESDFHQRRFKYTNKLIKQYAPNKKLKILDLGCGEGHLTGVISQNQDHEVYGLDYSISAIEYANKNFTGIDFVVADAYQPPYEDNYFDVVICNNIWEHVPDPLSLLNQITRVINPGGLLIISTPSRYRFGNVLRILVGIGTRFVSKLHVTEYSVGQVKEQLRFGGYEILDASSPVIKEKNIFFTTLKWLMFLCIKAIRSPHILEATVFYTARKRK